MIQRLGLPSMGEFTRSPERIDLNPGPYLARIVNHLDPKYMGSITVELIRDVGNFPKFSGQLYQVRYLSPFYGVTGLEYNSKNDDYDSTQKSYGMWMIPPDPGTVVMVIFAEGDPKNGFWIGCVQDEYINFMVPGLAATTINPDGERKPVAEFNKKIVRDVPSDTTAIQKPIHPFFEVLKSQGLEKDETRGYTTSSARREVPSSVFGISTPGPLDRKGPKGFVGTSANQEKAFVSRLGGSTLVMDDGDAKFLRKTKPQDGPPEYASVENGENGEDKIPHNELIRIRTRTGHQIVLHNSEDLIYIGNARGTTWIEMTSDGKIDIFAEDSVSVHTKTDLNFYAGRDINLESNRNLNIKVGNEMHTHVIKDQILIVDKNQKIHVKKDVDITYDAKLKTLIKSDVDMIFEKSLKHTVKGHIDLLAEKNYKHTVKGDYDLNTEGHNWFTSGETTEINAGLAFISTASVIHLNGPTAQTAAAAVTAEKSQIPKILKTHTLPDETGGELVKSIMRRIPTKEPYPHHENIDPKAYNTEKTDRDIDGRTESNSESIKKTPEKWKKELTSTDTFKKIGN